MPCTSGTKISLLRISFRILYTVLSRMVEKLHVIFRSPKTWGDRNNTKVMHTLNSHKRPTLHVVLVMKIKLNSPNEP